MLSQLFHAKDHSFVFHSTPQLLFIVLLICLTKITYYHFRLLKKKNLCVI